MLISFLTLFKKIYPFEMHELLNNMNELFYELSLIGNLYADEVGWIFIMVNDRICKV